jgi:hypothetical protein
MIDKIVSGGQTGADQAALDVAIEMLIPHGGWVPRGRKTEAGRLPDKYRMQEISSISYPQRTELNVADSDGTLIVSHGRLSGGSALTQKMARKHNRPCLHVDLDEMDYATAAGVVASWIEAREIRTLNVAGSRASKDPRIYEATSKLLRVVIERFLPRTVEEAVARLVDELSLREKAEIAGKPENEVSYFQHLGIHIRNGFGLWSGNEALLESCRAVSGKDQLHADEASMVIIRELWKTLKATHSLRAVK